MFLCFVCCDSQPRSYVVSMPCDCGYDPVIWIRPTNMYMIHLWILCSLFLSPVLRFATAYHLQSPMIPPQSFLTYDSDSTVQNNKSHPKITPHLTWSSRPPHSTKVTCLTPHLSQRPITKSHDNYNSWCWRFCCISCEALTTIPESWLIGTWCTNWVRRY
jgi:hypothetical protein